MLKNLLSKLSVAGLDLRALSVFRIIVGFNLIYNILHYRLFDVAQFYSNGTGMVPKGLLTNLYGDNFSLLNSLTADWMIQGFFVLFLGLSVLFMIGYRVKITGLLCMIFLLSTMNANPWVAHGPETLIEVSLFWTLFLPINTHYSFFPDKYAGNEATVLGFPAVAFMLQIGLIYLTSTVTKNGEFWQAGVVVESIASDMTHAGLLAGWLGQNPGLAKFLTYATLVVEGAVPLLIFFPWKNAVARTIAAICLLGVHIALAFTMEVGPFYLISSGFALVLLPEKVWDKLRLPRGVNFRPVKGRVKAKSLGNADALLRLVRNIALGAMVFFICQKNFAKWHTASYWSAGIEAVAPLRALASIELPRMGGTSGLFNQSWWLFAPDPYKEMGAIIFVGSHNTPEFYDLYTGELLFTIDRATNQLNIVQTPHVQSSGAAFVHNFYAKRYVKRLMGERLKKYAVPAYTHWWNFEVTRWKEANPEQKYNEISLILFTNTTSLENGKLVRDNKIMLLHSDLDF